MANFMETLLLISLQLQILDKLPKNVDSTTLILSNQAHGGEERLLSSLRGIKISSVGLQ